MGIAMNFLFIKAKVKVISILIGCVGEAAVVRELECHTSSSQHFSSPSTLLLISQRRG